MQTATANPKLTTNYRKPVTDFQAQARGDGSYSLKIRGVLPMSWASNLTHGLMNQGVSILSCSARRFSGVNWQASLILRPENRTIAMETINFNSLIRSSDMVAHDQSTRPRLYNYSVNYCIRGNGSIFVTIDGEDQVGFLASMFRQFANCLLFPWEIDANTSNGRIIDKFHLMGAAGIKPTDDMIKQLTITLDDMTVN